MIKSTKCCINYNFILFVPIVPTNNHDNKQKLPMYDA